MSEPLSTLFQGNVTIEAGCDTGIYGPGLLQVDNNVLILGTTNAFGVTGGALSILNGGLSVFRNSYLGGMLTVNSTSNLSATFIDTTLGPFSVSGGNAMTVSIGGNISLLSSSGNILLNASSGTTIISSGDNVSNAVQITASNNAGGGVTVLSGQSGGLTLISGSGGIQATSSVGNINLIANNGSANIIVNSSSANQNLTLAQYGSNVSSGILITADGSGANGNSSIQINSLNTAGNITIMNNTSGSGSITNVAGSGGYYVSTMTGGSIGLTANGGDSYFYVNSSGGSGQILSIGVTGGSYIRNQLLLTSNGTNPTQAILIQTTNTAGGIMINQPVGSHGGVVIDTGSSGLYASTQVGGGINLVANGSASTFYNNTTGVGQNLTICVNGSSANSLILCSQGMGSQAIQLNSTGVSGGIFATAAGSININTSDSTNGINIGTTTTVPVTIGTTNSTTTVMGNLDVRGTTTTVESTIVQINDNIIQINNGPSGTADGGVAIKRYQPANNNCIGDVVQDSPDYYGSVVSATVTTITLSTTQSTMGGIPTSVPNLSGWWIKITGGTGACECRRIKSNTGSILQIFSSSDQTTVGSLIYNTVPVEGLDWNATDSHSISGAIPDNTSTYALYPCEWIISMWDSVANRYILCCSPLIDISSAPPIAHYVDLQINNLIANNITASSINGTVSDTQFTFSLSDNSTAPYELSPSNVGSNTFPNKYGIYIVMIRPKNNPQTRSSGIFMIGSLGGTSCGEKQRLYILTGTSGEKLEMSWPASGGSFTGYPCVFYRPAPGTSTTTSYIMKLISV